MPFLGGLLIFIGLAGLVLGLVTLVKPIARTQVTTRRHAGAVLGAAFAVMVVGAACSNNAPATVQADVTKPTSTNTLKATPDGESAYLAALKAGSSTLAADLDTLFSLLSTRNLTSAKYRSDVIDLADRIIATAKTLRDLRAPSAKWAEFERALRPASDLTIEGVTLLKSGVTNNNVSAIRDGTAKLEAATAMVHDATTKIPR